MDAYEQQAARWESERTVDEPELAAAFARRVGGEGVRLDVGCGPGWYAPLLGGQVIASDAAFSMLKIAVLGAEGAPLVQHDFEALPFRSDRISGIWAHKCLMHVPHESLPMVLHEIARVLQVGGAVQARILSDRLQRTWQADPYGQRHFSLWNEGHLRRVFDGAGFTIEDCEHRHGQWLDISATRQRTLADVVGPSMNVLVVGLNPSVYSADRGVAFARPGNRFWPAALLSRLVTADRDPVHALRHRGVGFTDIVKRATARADELVRDEYEAGVERLRELVEWLEPKVIAFLGVTGYRVAVDRHASLGIQPTDFGGAATYVMPNPSGLNAHTNVTDLVGHFQSVARLASSVASASR